MAGIMPDRSRTCAGDRLPTLLRFTPCRRREQAFELTQPGVRHRSVLTRSIVAGFA